MDFGRYLLVQKPHPFNRHFSLKSKSSSTCKSCKLSRMDKELMIGRTKLIPRFQQKNSKSTNINNCLITISKFVNAQIFENFIIQKK